MKPTILQLFFLAAAACACGCSGPSIRSALTFHATFDGGTDAAVARGDARLYHAPGMEKRQEAKAGLPEGVAAIAPGKGKSGDALQFLKKSPIAVFYQGERNSGYRSADWSGTVSMWLSLDPDQDLEPGYCDPIQITSREWNDAAFFADFTKDDKPRHFRLGVFADRAVWDPNRRDWEAIPPAERPMVDIASPLFARGKWTHVAYTFDSFNTGAADGTARFYLDGKLVGELSARRQTFTWDEPRSAIFLGLSYIGLMDELAIFDRPLTEAEIRTLYITGI